MNLIRFLFIAIRVKFEGVCAVPANIGSSSSGFRGQGQTNSNFQTSSNYQTRPGIRPVPRPIPNQGGYPRVPNSRPSQGYVPLPQPRPSQGYVPLPQPRPSQQYIPPPPQQQGYNYQQSGSQNIPSRRPAPIPNRNPSWAPAYNGFSGSEDK